MRFYRFAAKYWLDIDGVTHETQGLVVAKCYQDAVTKLEHRLCHLESVYLVEWTGDTDFIFVDDADITVLDNLLRRCDANE